MKVFYFIFHYICIPGLGCTIAFFLSIIGFRLINIIPGLDILGMRQFLVGFEGAVIAVALNNIFKSLYKALRGSEYTEGKQGKGELY